MTKVRLFASRKLFFIGGGGGGGVDNFRCNFLFLTSKNNFLFEIGRNIVLFLHRTKLGNYIVTGKYKIELALVPDENVFVSSSELSADPLERVSPGVGRLHAPRGSRQALGRGNQKGSGENVYDMSAFAIPHMQNDLNDFDVATLLKLSARSGMFNRALGGVRVLVSESRKKKHFQPAERNSILQIQRSVAAKLTVKWR